MKQIDCVLVLGDLALVGSVEAGLVFGDASNRKAENTWLDTEPPRHVYWDFALKV